MSAKADNKKNKGETSAAKASANKNGKAENKEQSKAVAAEQPAADAGAKGGKNNAAAGGQIKRNIKPDIAVRDAELEAISAEFNKIKAERDDVSKKMRELKESSKGGNEERQKVRQELNKILDESKKVRADRDAILNQAKAAQQALEAKYAEERKAKDTLGKLSSVEAIDEEIQKIEKRMVSSNFSAKEEKDMIREMDKLRLSKKNIGALKSKADEVQKAKDAKKEIEARLNEKRAASDEVQKRFQNVKDALTALEEKDKTGIGAELPKLREKHDALNVQLDELSKKRKQVYEDFNKKMKEFIEAEQERRRLEAERRAAEQERRKQEDEERQRVFEEKRKAVEEEEMKKKPWEQEIALCDYLIGYLQRLALKSAGSSAIPGTATSAEASAPKRSGTDFGNQKPLVRGEDENYVKLGAEKKKPAKAAPTKVEKKDTTLAHSIDTLNSFSLLSLIPPSTEGAIDGSIAQLKEKRAYYDVLPRAPKAAPAAEVNGDKKAETEASKSSDAKKPAKKASNTNPPSVQDSSLFPTLPGAKPTDAPENRVWGPKATDAAPADQPEEVAAE